MNISKKLTIKAPLARTWETIGTNYASVGQWASAVYLSQERSGETKSGAPCHGRICETSLGPFTETIVAFDAARHSLSYVASGKKMPGFVKQLKATWRLKADGPGRTYVEMSFDTDIAFPFNILMGWMMKMNFNKVIGETMEELKFFLENNQVHPRKTKVMKKLPQMATGNS